MKSTFTPQAPTFSTTSAKDIRSSRSTTRITLSLNKATVVARKGPRKYYVISEQDIQEDAKYFKRNFSNRGKSKAKQEEINCNQSLRNYTFSPVFNSIRKGNCVDVYSSTYVIGEHAQISWLDSEKIWVFASRHSSIYLRSSEELRTYFVTKSHDFEDPCNIASHWLKFFEERINDKQKFLAEIKGKTL